MGVSQKFDGEQLVLSILKEYPRSYHDLRVRTGLDNEELSDTLRVMEKNGSIEQFCPGDLTLWKVI